MDTGITPITAAQEAAAEKDAVSHGFWMKKALALDLFLNVWIFNGDLDETISSHEARAATKGRWYGVTISKFLDLFEDDHGALAEAGDLARAKQLVQIEESTGTLPK